MHEFGIIEDLFKLLEDIVKKENLQKVISVNLQIGELNQIVPDTLIFAFEVTGKNTIFKDTKLNIEKIPIKMKCRSCKEEFLIEKNYFHCPSCKSSDLEIISGKEFLIKSIDGE